MSRYGGVVVMLVLASFAASAQNIGNVSGELKDIKSNPVSAATIYLLNTNYSVVSNTSGEFNIKNIRTGKYTLRVEAIGFASANVEISISPGTNENLQITLHNEANQLDDVVVTAEKKDESLQKVPVSITSLSSAQVNQYRLWNSKELTAIVPNLFSNNSGDERNVTSIRGITTTSYDPAVATYIDGVNQFSLDTYIPQLTDIERIEVLRGPQGTLYGRNAMGGVINIITKQPTNKTNAFVELNLGNYEQQRYSAGIRTPLIKDKLFFGTSVMFNKRDGYYTNEFNNTSFDKQQGFNGNYYLKFIPATSWALTLNVKHQNTRNDGAFPLVVGLDEALSDPFKLAQNSVGKMIDNTLDASLVINHVGAGFNFTSQTAWQHNHRYYRSPLDADFSPLDAVTIANDYGNHWNNVKVFTQELRFSSSPNNVSALKWTAGSYFFTQNNPGKQATHFGKDAALIGAPDSNFALINSSTGKNDGIAIYGQINYAVTKKFELIAGIRYDYENKKLQVLGQYQKDGEEAFVIQPDTSASVHFSALSPKLGLAYHATATNNFFATYSRGYRTGGLTQLSSDPSQPPLYPYKPEYSNNIEAGVKNIFLKNKLRINLTAFLTFVNDAQVPTLILPEAITITKNTGKLTSKGAELEIAATPLNGLQADYNFGYTNAKYKSLNISQNGETVKLDGTRQIFTPDFTSSFALQYSYTLQQKQQLKLVLHGEWFYLGTQYFDLANSIRQAPYNLLNTRLGISSKHLDIFFWERNVTNRKYIAYAYDFGGVHLADPKSYGVTLRLRL